MTPYFSTDRGSLYCGDCLEVMRGLEPDSIDSLITDPPYGLNPDNISKRVNKAFGACFNIMLPNFHKRDSPRVKYSELIGVLAKGSDLSGFEVLPIIKSFVGVPERPIDFDCNVEIRKKKVEAGDVSACFSISDSVLMDKVDAQGNKFVGNYVLNFGDSIDFSGGNVLSSNFGEFLLGGFGMPISAIKSPFFPNQSRDFPFFVDRDGVDDIVWNNDFSGGNALGAGFVLTGDATENGLMLTFDLRGGASKTSAAITTQAGDGLGNFIRPELIRTFAPTGSLSTKFKPCRVSLVTESANGTISNYFFHLWLPPNLLKSISNIQEKSSGFMGKKWDYDVPSVEIWRECLRVLKPGAHALIFAGSRTQHRMAVNVEDAGFILKDVIMYLYGSGFPKSTDISKQIDKAAGAEREIVGKYKIPADSDAGNAGKVIRSLTRNGICYVKMATAKEGRDITAPATPEAELWNGQGTHLKPSYEPILLAMKPNDGTYAQNALKHGVAGLNIDGGRIDGVTNSNPRIRNANRSIESENKRPVSGERDS